jgi:hypothetical protein
VSRFVGPVLDVVQPLARDAPAGNDYELIELAAHLFAVCCWLREHAGGADFVAHGPTDRRPASVEAACRQVATLGADTSPGDLYWHLIDLLAAVDGAFASEGKRILSRTTLREIACGDGRILRGDVLHWRRPRSVLSQLRDERVAASATPVPFAARTPVDHLRFLGMFWCSDERLPRVVIAAPGNIELVRESGRAATERRRFRVALCPLRGGFHTRFAIDAGGEFFTARDIAERREFEQHLEAVLDAAAAERVDLLVLPELCVDDEARGILTRASRSHSTIAGSFHFVRPRRGLPADERPVNEAVLYTRSGDAVLTHHKRGLFRIPRSHVTSPTMERFFVDRPQVLAAQVTEGIRWGSEIQVLDTSLGRLAVLICADAIDENAEPYRTTVAQLRPDLVFVVSMSLETERFEVFCEEMAVRRIGTVFVNAGCIVSLRRRAALAISDVALFEPPGSAPTRLRWCNGREDRLERFGFHDPKGWREHTPDAAAGWLGGERRLGLVVDLGVHWAE